MTKKKYIDINIATSDIIDNKDSNIISMNISISSDTTLTITSQHTLFLSSGLYTLHISNSDGFLNLDTVIVNDWNRLITSIQSHGLLGQTWKKQPYSKNNEVREIEGMVDDYAESDQNIWGIKTLYNKFITSTG